MTPMFLLIDELNRWYPLILAGLCLFSPVSRAVAVVIVARCVSSKLAELAIPLILQPRKTPANFDKQNKEKGVAAQIAAHGRD